MGFVRPRFAPGIWIKVGSCRNGSSSQRLGERGKKNMVLMGDGYMMVYW